MRAVVSSVLAVLLTVVPLKQVLGQAQQQAAITPELSVVVSPLIPAALVGLEPVSVVRLVPWVESARPILPTASLHLSAVRDATALYSVPAPRLSGGVQSIIIVLAFAVVIAAVVFLGVCGGDGACGA